MKRTRVRGHREGEGYGERGERDGGGGQRGRGIIHDWEDYERWAGVTERERENI